MPRKDFVAALRQIAAKHSLEFEAWSHDWIIQISDPTSGRRCNVFGYTFDANGAGAAEICKEKSATSMVLGKRGVANIPHHVFLNPANPNTADYIKRAGNWEDIRALVSELGFPLVVKPLKGTGGLDVFRAKCGKELEAAVQHIFSNDYGLAISPYKRIVDEYRCFCMDGSVEFVYRKVRSHVLGDGKATVAELVQRRMARAADAAEAQAVCRAAAELEPDAWARVPAADEMVPLQWKHNLGQGATVDANVPPEMAARLAKVALAAAAAVGARFCSADVVEVEGEGLMIMELNGGVMLDSLIGQLGDKGLALASTIYEKAVLRALELPLPAAAP